MKFAIAVVCLMSQFAWASLPGEAVGQKAHYLLDKDPARTSKMIRSGTVDATVTGFQAEANPPAYEVRLDYDFKAQFVGAQKGTHNAAVDAEYFEPAFLENLRKTGQYEGKNFKAEHLGYADAKTLDGKVYPQCDRVRLYDIQQPSELFSLASLPFGALRADVEDLEALAHVYPGVPVLGAVKLDVSGKYKGMRIKAGVDYQP